MANLKCDLGSVKSKAEVVQLIELGNGVVQITMKDEENSNGFSQELMARLFQCFQAVSQNNTYKVVILAGTSHYFATGVTGEQLMSSLRGESSFTPKNAFDLLTLALNCPIPVIAAMEGHALGGGFALGLYADFLVLSRESFYASNFMKYGFIPGAGAVFILLKKLGLKLGQEMIYTARNYRGEELAKRGVSFPVLPRKEVLKFAKKIANEIAEKPRLSLVTLKKYLTSEIRKKLPEVLKKELEMQEITFHEPEVKTRIELNFAVGNNQESYCHKHNQFRETENILSQLQSGDISLENAEKLFLGTTGEELQEKAIEKKKIDNNKNNPINTDSSEKILSLLSAGEISLENAESLLLEVVELDPKTETNGLTLVQNQEQISQQEEVLLQLQLGEVSLENAEKLFLGTTGEEVQEKAIEKKKIDNNKNNPINTDKSEEILSLLSAGEISLGNAESLLLEVVEAEPKIKTDSPTPVENTDIAIIGMSCRYPGAKNWKEFWQNLKNGVDSVTEAPPGRWEEKNWYHPDPEHSGTSYSKSAGFLDEIDKFDPLFFQISPGEAQFIEPQQRIFLEEAYHAIEDAGYAADSLKGKQCGVFVGATTNGDYSKLLSKSGLGTHRLALSGNQLSIVPARIAYFLDLRGPVVAVETACSASLVAVHQACESIKRGESELAIAGGIYTMLTPDFQILSSQFQMLSPEGHCKTFDAEASGTVWSEGCGVLLLKSYERAIRDQNHIYGVIKGTGVNYDGNTNGISAPSSQSQARLEEAVYQKFGINPETISYVEAHGTATPLGDPIEVEALTEAFSKWTNKKQFCAIGSVKTNIGHAATAAGVAGLIKTILCLKNQKLVPSLHFNQPNPHIDFENSPFYVNTEFKDWEVPDGKPRRAIVSSFGFSGTNAHIVVEEAPTQLKSQTPPLSAPRGKSKVKNFDLGERPCHILTLSAKCEEALQELVQRYEEFIENHSTVELTDVCFSANTGRSHFDHRLALVAESTEKLLQQLKTFATGDETTGLLRGQVTSPKRPKIAFLFTGQGSQYVDMGRELYSTQPVFRKTLEKCDEILSSYLDKPLLKVLYPEPVENSPIDETAYTQPALFAIEYALAKLWQSWGIQPDVVMGHSVGEYVAATIAGIFSLEDGLKLIAHRGRLMQQLPGGGEMVAVMASFEKVNQLMAPYREKVAIAAINGSESVVISGSAEAMRTVRDSLEAEGIKTKQLQVSHAFHSPLMEPILADFEAVANQITYHQPRMPLLSNITGTRADESITTASYWVNHVRQPVKFAQSMKTLHQQGYEVFLEIGPKPILLGMGRQCLPADVGMWLPSLRPTTKQAPELIGSNNPKSQIPNPKSDDWQQMLSSLAELYVQGVKVDWSGFDRDYARSKVVLPTYPFQQQKYWIETNSNFQKKQYLPTGKDIHPLLGKKLNCAAEQEIFASFLGEDSPAYLSMHRVFNEALFPATAYLEMAAAAGKYRWGTGSVVIEDLSIRRGLFLPPGELINVQTVLNPSDNKTYQFQIFSQQEQQNQEEQGWVLHATGKIRPEKTSETQTKIDLEEYQSECSQPIELKQHYQQFSQIGIDFGSSFQGIEKLWSGSNQALAQIKLPEELITKTMDYQFHPAFLDAALRVGLHTLPEINTLPETNSDTTYLPVGVEQFKIYSRPGLSLWAYASVAMPTGENQESLNTSVTLVSPEGEIIATIKGLQFKLATKKTLLGTNNWLYQIHWQPQSTSPDNQSIDLTKPGSWLLFSPPIGIGKYLAESLEQQGQHCILVTPGENYQQLESQHYQINPIKVSEFPRLLQESLDQQPPLRGIVHLWSLQSTIAPPTSAQELNKSQELGCGSVLHLVQAIVKNQDIQSPPTLWLVTQGSQSVGKESLPIQFQQAPLWGLGRVIAQEHRALPCRCVDLDPTLEDYLAVPVLLQELLSPDDENQIAYRQQVRHVARLARQQKAIPTQDGLDIPSQQVSIQPEGSYLITGGLGALGLNTAKWMVEQGAKHLVLSGRRQPSEKAQQTIQELQEAGAQVLVLCEDISQAEDVARIIEKIKVSLPPLRGIIHAAGVLDDGLLQQMSWERFTRVMAPKVQGAWHLHTLTEHLPLDFFVCFSSIASVLGSPGQGNYTAANAFMDALAHYRRGMGLPGLSINWGPWAEGGMAASLGSQHQNRLLTQGMSPITPERGFHILADLLAQDSTQVGVLPINWSGFFKQLPVGTKMPLLEAFTSTLGQSRTGKSDFMQRWEITPVEERRELLVTHVREQVARVLSLTVPKQIELRQSLFDLGIDSLMAVELRNHLEFSLGNSIRSTVLFDYPTLEELVDYLGSDVLSLELFVPSDSNLQAAEQEDHSSDQLKDQLKEMSQDEIANLFAQKLANLKGENIQ